MPQIEWIGSPNFWAGRTKPLIAIVDHITAGLMPGCQSWFQNPASKASAHFIVTRDGRILQFVKEGDTAWHAGEANKPNWKLFDGQNPNRYTVGIEHEAFAGQGLTEVQYQASLWLHRYLVQKYSQIKVDSDHILGHYRIDSVNRPNDPGAEFPWARLFNDLKGENDMIENLVIYKDGDVGAALTFSQSKGYPMVLSGYEDRYPAVNKHYFGVEGTDGNGSYYYRGGDRKQTALIALNK
jgi:hypothetical protein